MNDNYFRISDKAVWVFVIFGIVLATVSILFRQEPLPFLAVNVAYRLFLAVILISDMSYNNVYNKSSWISMVVLFPILAGVVYLVRRKKMLRKSDQMEQLNIQ